MRSKVDLVKDVARMIRSHFDGIVAWTQARQTNGFLEAIYNKLAESHLVFASLACTFRPVVNVNIA